MKNLTPFIILTISLLLASVLNAQTVYTDPEYPIADEEVTVYFNATGTDLEGYTGDVYTHTGVTVNGQQWQYVIGGWGNNSTQPQLTSLGSDLYKLDMSPSIRDFYGVPASGDISELCLVFRSSDSETQSADLFLDVFSNDLSIIIQQPLSSGLLVKLNETIEVVAASPLADSIYMYVNGDEYASVAGITIEETILANNFGTNWTDIWVKFVAKNQIASIADSFSYIVIPDPQISELPDGVVDGINYINETTVILSLFAPEKENVFVIGDFNDWTPVEEGYMNKTPDGDHYWIELDNLASGEEYAYQYFVDGVVKIGDPYCEKVLDPWNDQYISNTTYPDLKPYPSGQDGIVSVFQTNQQEYEWQNTGFDPPAVTDLVVYELLIRDFINQHTYLSLIDTLNYLKNLGVNAIELMPVNEFEGNLSWGYNPNFYFAPDKYYGPKNTLKQFIDACHGEGIAVILDVVYNHSFGTSPYVRLYWDSQNSRPAENSPFFNPIPKHDYNVGYDMNHESPATKQYISRAFKFWLTEYKVDGYRLDLSKGFTQKNTLGNVSAWGQYDQSRIDILEAYADSVWLTNEKAYMILEHFADNSEEKVLANYGMMLWGNSNYNYNEATMGWLDNSNFDWISYKKRGWSQPHVVGYMESHDEERLMVKNINYGNSNGSYNIKDTTIALQRQQLAAAFFFTIPGPKMIWQFGELGYDYNINYPGDIGGSEHRTDEKPIRWDYYNDYRRKLLYNIYASLADLKKNYDAFKTSDFDLSLSGATKSIHLNDPSMNVAIIGNFDVAQHNMSPDFQHTGMWYDYFSGDSLDVSNVGGEIALAAGEYRIYTDVKLETPETGLGIDDVSVESGKISYVYPNPAKGEVNIAIYLSKKSNIELNIYNINGQKIRSLVNENYSAGNHQLEWDVMTNSGMRVGNGIYFYELKVDDRVEVGKIILY
jgi:1,4-alpha-glucan branching enzyme